MQNQQQFSVADEATIRKVVFWLRGEHGAVSAQVRLPSGREVLVDRNGMVVS